jgi:hypothetical protein|tara:strand:+ start:40 stop:282 length:243 start_codon:yes stop_codon:yes gene_type:complete
MSVIPPVTSGETYVPQVERTIVSSYSRAYPVGNRIMMTHTEYVKDGAVTVEVVKSTTYNSQADVVVDSDLDVGSSVDTKV